MRIYESLCGSRLSPWGFRTEVQQKESDLAVGSLVHCTFQTSKQPDKSRKFRTSFISRVALIPAVNCEASPGAARSNALRFCQSLRQRFPRRACSCSNAKNRDLKLPAPNPRAPWRSITSKNSVGRSPTGLVKSCSK